MLMRLAIWLIHMHAKTQGPIGVSYYNAYGEHVERTYVWRKGRYQSEEPRSDT